MGTVGEPRRVVAVASELVSSLTWMTSTRIKFEAAMDLQKLFSAPITSFTTFYFEEGIPMNWTTELLDLCGSSVNVAPGCFGSAVGITEQEIGCSTNRSKAVVLICGWESKEHHLAHGKMDSVRMSVNSLMEKACGLDLFHVKLIQAASECHDNW